MTLVSNGGTTTLGLYDTQSQLEKKADITYVDNKVDPLVGGHKGFATLALAQSAQGTLPSGSVVEVTNDATASNNGLYLWNGTTLTKSAYDPLTQAKAYSDENKSFNLSIALTDGENFITEAQAKNNVLYFTGALTANATVTFPKKSAIYIVQNNTTGWFGIDIKTLDQTTNIYNLRTGAVAEIFNTGSSVRDVDNQKVNRFGGDIQYGTASTLASEATGLGIVNADMLNNFTKVRAGSRNIVLSDLDLTLTEAQMQRNTIAFTGALTKNVTVTVPNLGAVWNFRNATDGGFSVLLKGVNQSTVFELKAGKRFECEQNGGYVLPIGLVDSDVTTAITSSQSAKTIAITDTDTLITENVASLISITGVLTADRTITLSSATRRILEVTNSTTGNFKLKIKGSGGSLTYDVAPNTTRIFNVATTSVSPVLTDIIKDAYISGAATADTASKDDESTRIATTQEAANKIRAFDEIRSIALINGENALTVEQINNRENLTFTSTVLIADASVRFPNFTGKRWITNSTGRALSLYGATSSTPYVMKSGESAYILIAGNSIRTLPTPIAEIPVASSSVLGGVKIGSGLSIDASGVLSASAQPPANYNYCGNFKCGESYNVGDAFEHGSGRYVTVSNVEDVTTPAGNPAFKKLCHNDYAGPNRTITVKNIELSQPTQGAAVPTAMSKDGMIVFSTQNQYFRYSTDFGTTWTNAYTFSTTGQVRWVKELNDGQLMVSYKDTSVTPATEKIYRSTGWTGAGSTPTWTQVLTPNRYGIYYTDWSISQYKNIVLIAEYGAKTGVPYDSILPDGAPAGENCRYVHMSKDYGKTFTQMFDLNEFTDGVGVHVHGVCYDPYWNRTWVSHGDGNFGSNGLLYTDDFGDSWISATEFHNQGINFTQSVHIIALPTCLLLASDAYPNGIHRIDRAQGKTPVKGWYDVDVAYYIPDQLERLNHLCQSVFKAEWLPDAPYIFAFNAETQPAKSVIVTTFDGWTFQALWTDSYTSPAGKGLRFAIGPTLKNEIIALSNDDARTDYKPWMKVVLKVAID